MCKQKNVNQNHLDQRLSESGYEYNVIYGHIKKLEFKKFRLQRSKLTV